MLRRLLDIPQTLDPETFRDPGPEYRPAIMWIWNDDMDLVTLREQVADFKAKGIGGFFIHPMPDAFRKRDFIEGIKQPYPGETFFAWVKAAAEAAREHGLYCWLYDEGGWPSGTLVGRLAEGRPEIAGRVLRVQVVDAGSSAARPPLSPQHRAGNGGPEAHITEPRDEVALLPAADGRRLRFYASREGYPTDLLNPATTDAYLQSTHEGYAECLGEEFGGLVPGIFTDEASVGGSMGSDRIPWTPALPEEFRRRKGYDLLPYLPALFGEVAIPAEARPELSPEQAARVRYDFGDVWTQLHADAFYGRMRQWCRERGLLLVGHVGGEDDLMGHAFHGFGHFFRIMRHLDVPGVDVIWRQLFPGQPHLHFSKLASSAAHLGGKPLALSETFAVYGYGLTYRQMKWVTDRQYGDGINLMAPMAAHYCSTRGRAFCTMSNLARGNPTWPLHKTYADYVGRLSYLLRMGKPAACVAVLYPAGSLWVEADPAIAESFHAVTDLLQEAQIDFDYVDEDSLAGAAVERGAVRIGDGAYRAVVLPRTSVLPRSIVERLQELHATGGAVVAVDALPWLCAEEEHQADLVATLAEGFGIAEGSAPPAPPTVVGVRGGRTPRWRFLSTAERASLPRVVRELVEGDFALADPNPGIRYCHRILPEGDLYFIVNATEEAQEITAGLAGTGAAEVWDPDRGTIAPVSTDWREGRTRVSLALPPLGAVFVVLRRTGDGRPETGEKPDRLPPRALEITGPWEMAPVRAALLVRGELREEVTPAGCEAWRPVALRPWAELGLPDFSGSIAYRCRFEVAAEDAGRKAELDPGEVKHAAEVWINGRPAGTRLWPPFSLDVSGLLRPGANEVRVTVTNTWANQFLKPEEVDLARERGWYNTYARRVEPFQREALESGLLGPVRLFFR